MRCREESDFAQDWKEIIVNSTEEDAIVARGFFGPMRFLRNKRGIELVDATIRGAPDLYKGIPTGSSQEILDLELNGLDALFEGNLDEASILGGTVAGRIHSIPKVAELITQIVNEAEDIVKNMANLL